MLIGKEGSAQFPPGFKALMRDKQLGNAVHQHSLHTAHISSNLSSLNCDKVLCVVFNKSPVREGFFTLRTSTSRHSLSSSASLLYNRHFLPFIRRSHPLPEDPSVNAAPSAVSQQEIGCGQIRGTRRKKNIFLLSESLDRAP